MNRKRAKNLLKSRGFESLMAKLWENDKITNSNDYIVSPFNISLALQIALDLRSVETLEAAISTLEGQYEACECVRVTLEKHKTSANGSPLHTEFLD